MTLFIGIIRKTLEFLLETEHMFLYNVGNERSFLGRLRAAAKQSHYMHRHQGIPCFIFSIKRKR